MQYLAISVPGYGEIDAPAGIPSRGGFSMLSSTGSNAFVMVFIFAIIIALMFILWGGLQWITSQGDKSKLQAARMRITYSVIGLVLLFLSFFIVNMVGYFFNVKLF